MTTAQVRLKALFLLILSYIGLGALIFLPAFTLNFWQGWLALVSIMGPATLAGIYFIIKDPKLVERRLRMKEKESVQKGVVRWAIIVFLIAFIIPGLDHRFGWSNIPSEIVITADVLMIIGYLIVFRTLQTNSYAARTVEVEKEQKLITTGLYGIVRHPMYVGVIIMYYTLPIVMGSYWAIIPLLPLLPIMVIRTLNEEQVLKRGLPGYKEYCKKVKYRLIPGIW
ncbi:isoprenylcysteine carboxylmethyltransferase family protein [Candidatus Peregrinibacteria bacterium]|nr:isoprenylcysteine carboxylmethyltransferase family protein [Candidatus Peregrinibacteria bacterium]